MTPLATLTAFKLSSFSLGCIIGSTIGLIFVTCSVIRAIKNKKIEPCLSYSIITCKKDGESRVISQGDPSNTNKTPSQESKYSTDTNKISCDHNAKINSITQALNRLPNKEDSGGFGNRKKCSISKYTINLRKAIKSSGWYDCQTSMRNQKCHFKIKIISFRPIDSKAIERPTTFHRADGRIWLLAIEIINLGKTIVSTNNLRDALVLVDNKDDHYKAVDTSKLIDAIFEKEHGIKNALCRLWAESISSNAKVAGSLAFMLSPKESNYSLGLKQI